MTIRVACIQRDLAIGEPIKNAQAVASVIREISADLILLPEAFLTGYAVASREGAAEIAIPRVHEAVTILQQAVDEGSASVVVGFAEKTPKGSLANSAALLSPSELPRFYQKTHLPTLGLDKHVTPGCELGLYDMPWGKLGVLICFDLRHPEAAKCLALAGADIIALPTNWPEGAEVSADHIAIARAAENNVFLATCNRVGTENGFRFIGRSKIIGPNGEILAQAGEEAIIITAEIELEKARNKQRVVIPGEYETNVLTSRRPELYSAISEHKSD